MSELLIIGGAIGISCMVASLVGLAIALSRKGNWPMVLACLAGMSTIIFLTVMGIEYSNDFWKGRS